MYVQVQFLYNIMKYSNNFKFFSTQASQQRASTPYSWSTGLVDSTSQVQNWILAINIIYQFQPYYCHPPQVSSLGCAPHLPRFRLHGPPRRAGWRDWSTACRDVIALIRQVNGERSPIGIKFKPIPATSTNIIQDKHNVTGDKLKNDWKSEAGNLFFGLKKIKKFKIQNLKI